MFLEMRNRREFLHGRGIHDIFICVYLRRPEKSCRDHRYVIVVVELRMVFEVAVFFLVSVFIRIEHGTFSGKEPVYSESEHLVPFGCGMFTERAAIELVADGGLLDPEQVRSLHLGHAYLREIVFYCITDYPFHSCRCEILQKV